MQSRTVLITGGSRGIGKATAIEFAKKGYNIIITHNNTDASDTINEIKKYCVSAIAVKTDLTKKDDINNLAKTAVNEFCGLDILINNAGIMWQGLFTDMSEELWQKIFATNVTGPAMLTKKILPHMISRKKGIIINVSSIWGECGASTEVAYSSSKAALIGFSKSLAQELEPSGIKVEYITPGAVATDMLTKYSKTELREIEKQFSKINSPEEIAKQIINITEKHVH